MRHRGQLAIFLFAILSLDGESAFAARLLTVTFERDGRLLLQTSYDDDGFANAATVWRYLGRKPIMVAASSQVLASTVDPLRADLSGDVTISVRHVNRLIARAKVSHLTLARSDPSDTHWFLPGDEVERTARIAGLGPAVPPTTWPALHVSPGSGWIWCIALATYSVPFLGLWWFVRRLRNQHRRPRDGGLGPMGGTGRS